MLVLAVAASVPTSYYHGDVHHAVVVYLGLLSCCTWDRWHQTLCVGLRRRPVRQRGPYRAGEEGFLLQLVLLPAQSRLPSVEHTACLAAGQWWVGAQFRNPNGAHDLGPSSICWWL